MLTDKQTKKFKKDYDRMKKGGMDVEKLKTIIGMLIDETPLPSKTKAQRQLEAFDKFVSAIRSIDDEPLTDEDFAELENNRANFNREMAL